MGIAVGLGADPAIETTVASADIATTSGGIDIDETDDIALISIIDSGTGSIDLTVAGTITITTVTASGGAVNLNATAGDILDTAGGMITAGATSSLRASGIIGTVVPLNPVDVDINGDLWVWAGDQQNQVSVSTQGRVVASAETERVEIFEPSPQGLVMHDNHLFGGNNYGSGSNAGSILSRGYGEIQAERNSMFNSYYIRALQPWGYKTIVTGVVSEANTISEELLNGPEVIIDGSEVGIKILPPELLIVPEKFQPRYYITKKI